MVYTPVPTRGGPAPRIAVFGIRPGAFDPIGGGPERIAAARGKRSAANGPRFNFHRPVLRGHRAGLTFTGQTIAARGSRPVGFCRRCAALGPACLTG